MEDKKWLVRSGNQIFGPFNDEEISEQLGTRQLVSLDEIVEPNGIWHYIRDELCFKAVLDEISLQNMNLAEHTETSTLAIDQTLTDIKPNTAEDEVDPDKASYSYEGDNNIGASSPQRAKYFWWVAVILVSFSAAFLFHRILISDPQFRKDQAQQLKKTGYKSLSLGDYKRAQESFEKSAMLYPEDKEFYKDLSLLLVYSGKTTSARHYLDQVSADIVHEQKVVIESLLALKEQNYTKSKAGFEALITTDYKPSAIINNAFVLIQKKKYKEATEYLTSYTEFMSTQPLMVLLLAEANIQSWVLTENPVYLIQTQNVLRDSIGSSSQYYQESLIIRSYVSFLLEDSDQQKGLLQRAIDFDPQQSSSFKENVFVDSRAFSWKVISSWCLSMLAEETVLNVTGRAICLYKGGKAPEAMAAAKKAMALDPKNPLAASVYSYLLMNSGELEKAKLELNLAIKNNTEGYLLPTIMQARLCEFKENRKCSFEAWQKVYERDKNYLFGVAGLVDYYMSKGQWNRANQYLLTGLEKEKYYKPFVAQKMLLSERPER